jgi:diketogulonate reductase-like aldo/keto reductase
METLTLNNGVEMPINVFDFELSADEIAAIDGLDTGRLRGLRTRDKTPLAQGLIEALANVCGGTE